MQFNGKVLTLTNLGEVSEKAKASWDYFGFDRVAAADTLCAQAGWKGGWRALLSGSEAVIVVDESLDLNGSMVFPDKDEFILWLEQTYDDRE